MWSGIGKIPIGVIQLNSLPGVVPFGFDALVSKRYASEKRPLCASSIIDTWPVTFLIKNPNTTFFRSYLSVDILFFCFSHLAGIDGRIQRGMISYVNKIDNNYR